MSEPTKVCPFCGAAASILDNHPVMSCIRNLVSQRDDDTQRAEAAEAERAKWYDYAAAAEREIESLGQSFAVTELAWKAEVEQRERAEAERDALQSQLQEIHEREAECCGEDESFDERIEALTSERDALRKDAARRVDAVDDAAGFAVAEVSRAMVKFPTWPTDPFHALAVVGEEFGELQKAVLQHSYETHKSVLLSDIRDEAIQLAAMALRFVVSLAAYRHAAGEQHDQSALDAALAVQP